MIYIDKEDIIRQLNLVHSYLINYMKIQIQKILYYLRHVIIWLYAIDIGYELYNNVADVIQSATDDKELIKKTLDDAESAQEYLSIAKEKFLMLADLILMIKLVNYAKELSKVIKQLRKLFIPALEEEL